MNELPELFDSRLRARSLAYLFIAGALTAALTIALPHGRGVDELGLGLIGLGAALIGAALLLAAERAVMWQLHLALALGTGMVALANEFTGQTALYPLLFSWPILYAFYFLKRRAAIAHVIFAGLAYAVVLALGDLPSSYVRWLLAIGTPTVAGVLVSGLLDRVLRERLESRERELLLSQQEARTRIVLDSAPDAFVAIDRDGSVRTWNAAAERMLGWSAAEAVGKPLRALIIPPELREANDRLRRDLLDPAEADATRVLELELQRRDGSRFPAEVRASRVTIRGEVFAAGFLRDVSDRLRREAEREALLREQAARVEAERVMDMVSGMQALVDAALAHRTLRDILPVLVTRLRAVLKADAAAIYLAEERERLLLGAASGGTPGGGKEGTPMTFEDGFAGRVAARREAILGEPDGDAMIGVPLLAGGELTGVLVVSAASPRRFSADDLNLLRLAADRVALAIDHARLYERELRIAETLQRSLLPERLPQMPGLDVSARYLPAAAEAEVGGDWYDVLPISGGGVGLVMGDIAGKGLAAASMVGRLRSALRAYALEGHSPAQVVERLNRLIWTEGQEGQMATLLFVVVDPVEGRVAWVNAGHPPPLLVAARRAAAFPGRREQRAPRRAAVSRFPGGVPDGGAPGHRRALHGRADRAAGREHQPRPGPAGRTGARRAGRLRGALRPAAPIACSRRCALRRRGSAGAADDSDVGPLRGHVRARAGVAGRHAFAPAPLAAPRRSRRARDRRDRDRLRRGGHERAGALRRRRQYALRLQRPCPRPKGRAGGARSRRLATPSKG